MNQRAVWRQEHMPDYGFLRGCFPGKIAPSDFDLFVERNGYFLAGEWKRPGENTDATGQRRSIEALKRLNPDRITVIRITGEFRQHAPESELTLVEYTGADWVDRDCTVEVFCLTWSERVDPHWAGRMR